MKWPKTFTMQDAKKIQERLRRKVRVMPLRKEPRYVAGVDAAFSNDRVFAAACLFLFPEIALIEQQFSVRNLSFPYVPGFLSFREGPAIIAAINALSRKPDLILVDGQGIAHPLGIGIASFIGVITGVPTIGCAKSRLIGEYAEPAKEKGNWSPLMAENNIIGAVLRSRDNTRPLFVSPGNKTDLNTAIRIALDCTGRYRIPEPLRCADMLSKRIKNRR